MQAGADIGGTDVHRCAPTSVYGCSRVSVISAFKSQCHQCVQESVSSVWLAIPAAVVVLGLLCCCVGVVVLGPLWEWCLCSLFVLCLIVAGFVTATSHILCPPSTPHVVRTRTCIIHTHMRAHTQTQSHSRAHTYNKTHTRKHAQLNSGVFRSQRNHQ